MAWRSWLLRATAGDPSQMQIMYGAGGERRLDEWEVDWLPGYEDSRPVRIGNAAAGQFQLDVYGEVMSALYESAQRDELTEGPAWDLQLALMDFLETGWRGPDDGIWEVRGPQRQFTHSKVMAWVAIDRAIKTVEKHHVEGPVDRWRSIRTEIHDEVCDKGFNPDKGSFTQYYGSDNLDASLLMIPMVDFLPATDPRVRGTIEAIERELVEGDFVLRYRTQDTGEVDGLSGREGAFLACSFWLVDCLMLLGRENDARQLFQRLLDLRNDLGLLSEEYDPVAGRLVGNFPQAFSHVSLVNSAANISGHAKPAADHVFLGLARQALGGGPAGMATRHMRGPATLSAVGDMVARRSARSGVVTATAPEKVLSTESAPKRQAPALQRPTRARTKAAPTRKAAPAKKARPAGTATSTKKAAPTKKAASAKKATPRKRTAVRARKTIPAKKAAVSVRAAKR
jgi:hypothetical protein